jgi:hypothetical protein
MTTNLAPNTRVRVIARPHITGTFVSYFKPFNNGSRNTNVIWDDASFAINMHESQIEAI